MGWKGFDELVDQQRFPGRPRAGGEARGEGPVCRRRRRLDPGPGGAGQAAHRPARLRDRGAASEGRAVARGAAGAGGPRPVLRPRAGHLRPGLLLGDPAAGAGGDDRRAWTSRRWTLDQIVAEAHAAYLRRCGQSAQSWGGESLGELARYIEPNDYPAGIRGTLRDAVSYLFAELLADSSLWRPEQSNELYRLDRRRADRRRLRRARRRRSSSPTRRPPATQARRGARRPRGLASRRRLGTRRPSRRGCERLRPPSRRLRRGRRPSAPVRAAPRVGARAASTAAHAWWSAGHGGRSPSWSVSEDDAGRAGARARQIAGRGAEAPPGERRRPACRHLIGARSRRPSTHLAAMASDGAGQRRSVQVTHRNLPALHFRAYPLDLDARLIRAPSDYNLLPGWQEVPESS